MEEVLDQMEVLDLAPPGLARGGYVDLDVPHTLCLQPNYDLGPKVAGMTKGVIGSGSDVGGGPVVDAGSGDEGIPLPLAKELITNFLRPHIQDPIPIYKYYIKFTPVLVNPIKKVQVVTELMKRLGRGISSDEMLLNEDRNTLYLKAPLESNIYTACTIKARPPGQRIIVDLEILPAQNYDSYEFTRDFMETLLKDAMAMLKYGKSGPWFFHSLEETNVLELPRSIILETSPGYTIGMRQTDIGPLFWMDQFSLTKRQEKLYGSECLEKEYIFGRIITCDVNNLFYRVDEIVWEWNPLTKLPWSWYNKNEEEFQYFGEVSYNEFLLKQYGIVLSYSDQPLILTKWNKSEFLMIPKTFTIAKDNELYYVNIPELCRLSGWKEQCRRDPMIAESLAEEVNVCPDPRMSKLKFLVEEFSKKQVTSLFGSWGVKLEDKLFSVNGKILTGPKLTFGNGDELLVSHAYPEQMFQQLAYKGCYMNVKIKRWILVFPVLNYKDANCLKQCFMDACHEIGNVVQEPLFVSVKIQEQTEEGIAKCVEEEIGDLKKQVQFALILLPKEQKGKGNVYDGIKKLLLLKLGVPSQCIKLKSWSGIEPKEASAIGKKLALQATAKLGGELWRVDIPHCTEETMFIGIDAYHNIPRKHSSVYGVVFSLNPNMTKFLTKVVIQKTGQEIGEDLTPMTVLALQAYSKERKTFPKNIVVFRDGVSNAYFDLVKSHEVKQITAAFDELKLENKPKILFTVIQKHTTDRIFVQDEEKFCNPVPGTVVDELITRTKYMDFLMWSQHFRGKGSSYPVRVSIIESPEDTEFSSLDFDMTQSYAYASTFAFYNWTGSIRVPAPLQYAHKAAGLVGKHLKEPPLEKFEKTLYYL